MSFCYSGRCPIIKILSRNSFQGKNSDPKVISSFVLKISKKWGCQRVSNQIPSSDIPKGLAQIPSQEKFHTEASYFNSDYWAKSLTISAKSCWTIKLRLQNENKNRVFEMLRRLQFLYAFRHRVDWKSIWFIFVQRQSLLEQTNLNTSNSFFP